MSRRGIATTAISTTLVVGLIAAAVTEPRHSKTNVWHVPGPHTDVCRIDQYTWRVYDEIPNQPFGSDHFRAWLVTDIPANHPAYYDNQCG